MALLLLIGIASVALADSSTATHLDFVKKVGADVWNRVSRTDWLEKQTNPRLVGQDPDRKFLEYAGGDNLVKVHAIFLDDQLAILETQIIRSEDSAKAAAKEYITALGKPDSDDLPDDVQGQLRRDTVVFHQWRIKEDGKDFLIRCSIIRFQPPDPAEPVLYFFKWMVGDGNAVAGKAGAQGR